MSEEFKFETDKNGIKYYKIPVEYNLFKATREFNETNDKRIILDADKPYFFGECNMDADYIKTYEDLYGIIYHFKTTHEYNLLALDDKQTLEYIYNNNAPENIQKILRENYGFLDNIRNSISENDRILSEYLCNNGYEGYAIKSMKTDFGGTFHPEFMICNINGIECIRRITNDTNVDRLKKQGTTKISEDLRDKRKSEKRKNPSSLISTSSVISSGKNLFNDDDDDDEYYKENKNNNINIINNSHKISPVKQKLSSLFGGNKKHKKRKTNKKHSRKTKKSHKTKKARKSTKYNKPTK